MVGGAGGYMLDNEVEVIVAVPHGPRRSVAAVPERAREVAPRYRSTDTQASKQTALTQRTVFDQYVRYVDWHRECAPSDGISDDNARASQTTRR